jgi:hypothetical protein
MGSTESGYERRRSPRIWQRAPASIILVRGMKSSAPMSCEILNRSKGGALLLVSSAAEVPDDFYLSLKGQQDLITCSVARRGQKLLGVRFVPRPSCNVRVITTSPG